MFDQSLFVEAWESTFSFEEYYSACAPRSLTYSHSSRLRVPKIFTVCVSAFGGLVIAWQFISPAIVKIWNLVKWKKQLKKQSIAAGQMGIEQAIMQMAPKPINKGFCITDQLCLEYAILSED
jgi:hypothetical protein